MLIKDIPNDHAEKLISAIGDLRPEMIVRVVAEDYALYQLGLIQYVPCSVEIEASEDEITELADEVLQMEIDAWNFDDRELKNPEIAKQQKELEEERDRLRQEVENSGNREYVQEQARKQFKLLNPGELLFTFEEE